LRFIDETFSQERVGDHLSCTAETAWILAIVTAAFSTIFVTVQFCRAASSATAFESVAASFASFAAASAEEYKAIGFRHTFALYCENAYTHISGDLGHLLLLE